jgi:hypothetical protein
MRYSGSRWPFFTVAIALVFGAAYYLVIVPLVFTVLAIPVSIALSRIPVDTATLGAGLGACYLFLRYARRDRR